MKKIKIIDLLNKIANGEEVPKKIKYLNIIYEYNDTQEDYFNEIYGDGLLDKIRLFRNLTYEAEIIEEEKDIEKLDVALLGQCDNWLQHQETKEHSCVELNPYIIDNIRENTLYFQIKINELIDTINELKGKSE